MEITPPYPISLCSANRLSLNAPCLAQLPTRGYNFGNTEPLACTFIFHSRFFVYKIRASTEVFDIQWMQKFKYILKAKTLIKHLYSFCIHIQSIFKNKYSWHQQHTIQLQFINGFTHVNLIIVLFFS